MRSDTERLHDIVEAIAAIDRYAQQGREAFEQSELIQVWMVRHLEIIGEAARVLSDRLKAQHPEVPWRKIAGLRNIAVHEYFRVELSIVWDIIQNDLTELKAQIEAVLRQLEG
ncbi:MAG: DUF86 domain-containing protein [Lyngbya sp. HA4199-MV5]|jgi:uncharacterized protein with HEPN domain|nr:DUF86 domain-containing protein [Lyngbya sp. HA4199-MV5]